MIQSIHILEEFYYYHDMDRKTNIRKNIINTTFLCKMIEKAIKSSFNWMKKGIQSNSLDSQMSL